jgi:hypothetical protein
MRPVCAPLGACIRQVDKVADDLTGLAVLFGCYFSGLMVPAGQGPGSRRRRFDRVDIFWAFLSQVLKRGDPCRAALTRLQASILARGRARPSDNTSAYCQGRLALDVAWLQSLFGSLGKWFAPRSPHDWLGRRVRMIDGSCFSMPDSDRNRAQYPYAGGQKSGCGFPVGKLVTLFCLHTGRLIAFAHNTWKTHELRLARELVRHLRAGEVVLADRLYCGYEFLTILLGRKIDFVVRLHSSRKIGKNHRPGRRVTFKRGQRKKGVSRRLWRRVPEEITLRIVRFTVRQRGYRTKTIVIATSLLDHTAFPDEAIAELYRLRWQIELHYRQIKTNLGLDVLRALTPAMIERELWMHAIAYNLIRALMLEAAITSGVPLQRLSFKGTVDLLEAWAQLAPRRRMRRALRHQLLSRIASDRVPLRPGRSEPRARKRRPKNYQFLTQPRRKMQVFPSRFMK